MSVATVVVPTHDHGPTLEVSVASALVQTVEDLEVFIVGDGVPPSARAICQALASSDPRVRFFDNPKGPRHGEIHRHRALEEATGSIVCYLSDDDLWLPDHVESLAALLADAEFAHTLPLAISTAGEVHVYRMDLESTWFRPRAFDDRGIRDAWVPLTFAGHTLEAYRRLAEGWSTTPGRLPTDRYMWRKFVSRPDYRARSGTRPTALNFPSPDRRDWTADQRVAELRRWAGRLSDADGVAAWRLEVLDSVVRDRARLDARPGRRLAEAVMRPLRLNPLVRRLRR